MQPSRKIIAIVGAWLTTLGSIVPGVQAQESVWPPDVKALIDQTPKPPPSNQQVGIDIDRFIGHPFQSEPRVIHGTIVVRSILRQGNPYEAGEPGAVLEYRKELAEGTIQPFKQTALVTLPEQQFWYIESGQGRLDDGENFWDLREGIGILIPPGFRHRVRNTSDKPLQMLLLFWENPNPRKNILVRDVHAMPLPGAPSHWNYFGTDFFSPEDGLHPNEQFAVVYMPPMTIAEPHAHIRNWEEIWVKLPPNDAYLMLGSEVRPMPPNTAFLAPPNGETVHSVVNLTPDKTQAFMYLGRWRRKQPPHPERPIVQPHLVGRQSSIER